MTEYGIHHLPVVEDERPVGIVGLRDVTAIAAHPTGSRSAWDSEGRREPWERATFAWATVMTRDVVSVTPDTPLKDVAAVLVERGSPACRCATPTARSSAC
jgi:CBS domain-containing protein